MLLKTIKISRVGDYLKLLDEGNERGLTFFYKRFFNTFYIKAFRGTKKDCCAATSIVQEAFLKLWLCREQVKTEQELIGFLQAQVRANIYAYYEKSQTRFQRSLLQVDGFENADEYLLIDRPVPEENEDLSVLDDLERERRAQLIQLKKLLPTLKSEQKLFIRLCLKYSFNYDRIAYYLGGISDYEVGMKVEAMLAELRQIFTSSDKLALINRKETKFNVEGNFSRQQEEVFRMRYTLRYSFEQISEAMQLSEQEVKRLFVAAHAVVGISRKQGIRNKEQRIIKL